MLQKPLRKAFKSFAPIRLRIGSDGMTKQKFSEAENRLYNRVFVCMKCGAKLRSDLAKVRAKKIKCRKCRAKQLRPIHKDRKT